uniref:Uncharacterized protein n=1 Tax=Rhizophora mucronata TaxID=61149 RepID=A0A2P2NLQ4_RHIMU
MNCSSKVHHIDSTPLIQTLFHKHFCLTCFPLPTE